MWESIPHKRRVGCGHRILNMKPIFENQREDSKYSFSQAGSCLVVENFNPKKQDPKKFQKQDPKNQKFKIRTRERPFVF